MSPIADDDSSTPSKGRKASQKRIASFFPPAGGSNAPTIDAIDESEPLNILRKRFKLSGAKNRQWARG